MRLWSLHPVYLDRLGLVACWREGLGALKALAAWERSIECGYQNHPQLDRFKRSPEPGELLVEFNKALYDEAVRRGYDFDLSRLWKNGGVEDSTATKRRVRIAVHDGQVRYEAEVLLLGKLRSRRGEIDKERILQLQNAIGQSKIRINPVFRVVAGGIEEWEKIIS